MNRRGSVVIVALCGAATLVYVFVAFLPGQRKMAEMQQSIAQKQSVIEQAPVVATQLALLRSENEDAQQFVAQWRATAPGSQKLGELLAELTQAARQHRVELISLQPQPAQPMTAIHRDLVALEISGKLKNIHQFLWHIESLPPSIWVDRFELEKDGKDGESLRCEMTLSIFSDLNDISD